MKALRGIRDALNHRLAGRRQASARVFYMPELAEEPPSIEEEQALRDHVDKHGLRGIEER